jgi:hypothetical protein
MSVLLVGLMLLLAMPQASPAQATGSIAGVVRAADTHVPVPDARVLITGPGVREDTTTDGAGRFAFTLLAPGVYRISIEKETYAFDVLRAPGVKVDAGATMSVTFDLQRAGMIVGDVRDDRGNPRRGVPVTAIRKIEGGTRRSRERSGRRTIWASSVLTVCSPASMSSSRLRHPRASVPGR